MLLHIVYFITFFVIAVNSNDSLWRYVNETVIEDQNYCYNRNCVLKCCPDGYLLMGRICRKAKRKPMENVIKFSKTKYLNQMRASDSKNIPEEIFFVYNSIHFNNTHENLNMKGLKDGIFYKSNGDIMAKLTFCVDYMYVKINMSNGRENKTARFVYRLTVDRKDPYLSIKELFLIIGLSTSCVFLVSLLLIYNLLPDILNRFNGKLLMSYVVAVTICFALRVLVNVLLMNAWITEFGCSILSPVMYFFILANFFWLLCLSYDIWKLISNIQPRKSLSMSGNLTKSEKKKIYRYYAFSYGVPGIITAFITIIYLTGWHHKDWEPPFKTCLYQNSVANVYVNLPIGIIITINIIFFLMCIYQIWIVPRALNIVDSTVKRRKNRLYTHLRLFVLMGLSWLLELIPDDSMALFIISSIYNVFIGVIIFLMVTWNKQIYKRLYEKFVLKKKEIIPNSQSFKSNASDRLERGSIILANKTRASVKREQDNNEEQPMQTAV